MIDAMFGRSVDRRRLSQGPPGVRKASGDPVWTGAASAAAKYRVGVG
jgi:hypothetical protein